jgi:hypothetical protein
MNSFFAAVCVVLCILTPTAQDEDEKTKKNRNFDRKSDEIITTRRLLFNFKTEKDVNNRMLI